LDILAKSLWVHFVARFSNSSSGWWFGGITLQPVECPQQVDSLYFIQEQVKSLHHMPEDDYKMSTTAKIIVKKTIFGIFWAKCHARIVVDGSGNAVDICPIEGGILLMLGWRFVGRLMTSIIDGAKEKGEGEYGTFCCGWWLVGGWLVVWRPRGDDGQWSCHRHWDGC